MNKIAELRKKRHMTQTALALKLNVTQNMISFYESGKNEPSINTLTEMSKIFNVSVDYIIGNSSVPYTADSIIADRYNPQEAEMLELFKSLPHDKQQRAIGIIQAIRIM